MGKSTFKLAGREWEKISWWNMKGMRSTYILLWAAMLTSATNGYDGSLINGLQSIPTWQAYFNHPSPSTLGLLTASMAIGSMLAIPIAPYTADSLGRRTGVVIGCAIMLVGVALLSMGFHIAMFIIGRLVLGFGIEIAHGAAPLLIAELVHPQHRAIYSTIYNTLWYGGSVIGAGVSYGTGQINGNWAWRVPCLLQAIPSLSQIIFIWFVPESPRWLMSKNKPEQALKVLAKVHAQGDENDELVQVEFNEIQQTIRLEQEYEKNEWKELWSTPGNRHRLLILVSIGLFSQWSGNALVSYYLKGVLEHIGITNSKEQLQINVYLSVVQLVSAVGICFFVDKIGRRPLFITSCIGMLICYMSETIGSARYDITKDTAAGNTVIVFIFLYFIFYNLGFCGLLVSYSTEILPYRIRAKGLAVMFLFVNIALWFNQYVNPIALEAIGWRYYIVYTVWIAFELFVVWKWFIETKNTALEEIARYFDGENAIIGGDESTMKAHNLQVDDDDHPVTETKEAGTDTAAPTEDKVANKV